jgi:hypothetical protein
MIPCHKCVHDPDVCKWHPCNGCDANDNNCNKCRVHFGFDCNCFEQKNSAEDDECEGYPEALNPFEKGI